jgi:hypothetical protein
MVRSCDRSFETELLPEDAHGPGGCDAESDLASAEAHHGDLDIAIDDDGLIELAGQD